MRDNFNLLTVQKALGYTFKNAELIKAAFVHRSFEGVESNLKLGFVGEKLVEFIIADYLFSHGATVGEKQLEHLFNSYIEALKPEKYIIDKGLCELIKLSSLNESLRKSKAVCREVFFAVCTAIYKDGGLPALKSLLMPMIRSLDKGEHYAPSLEGKIITTDDTPQDTDKHIKNARVKPSKSGIGISKAETVKPESSHTKKERAKKIEKSDAPIKEEKTKKSGALSKLFGKKDAEPEKKAEAPAEESAQKKRFIRDALEPVKLSDDLRNFKPKKSARTPDKPSLDQAPVSVSPQKEAQKESNDENYKSLLQETVQKNIRSANVLLQYKSRPVGKTKWYSEVVFMDKVIGKGEGEGKRLAEKLAAQSAYKAITNKNSEIGRWFASKRESGAVIEAPQTDYVSKINQYFQKTQRLSSAPITYEKRHSPKKGVFKIAVVYEGKEIGAGEGKNPKEAKQNAAKEACRTLNIK